MSVTFISEVAGTVQDFNSTSFRVNLASFLGDLGVVPSDVEVTVTPASVLVTAKIRANAASANGIIERLVAFSQSSNSAMSDVLGVTVIRAEAPTMMNSTDTSEEMVVVVTSEGSALSDDASSSGNTWSGGLVLAVISAVLVVLACAICVYCLFKRSPVHLGVRRIERPRDQTDRKQAIIYDVDVIMDYSTVDTTASHKSK